MVAIGPAQQILILIFEEYTLEISNVLFLVFVHLSYVLRCMCVCMWIYYNVHIRSGRFGEMCTVHCMLSNNQHVYTPLFEFVTCSWAVLDSSALNST